MIIPSGEMVNRGTEFCDQSDWFSGSLARMLETDTRSECLSPADTWLRQKDFVEILKLKYIKFHT